jgi:RimJ/RimL family protein N-acetyltransferase
MWQDVIISIRQFEKRDIPKKVEWINNPENNRYLHYDLPLQAGKTEAWFDRNQGRTDRYDAVIEADGVPVGLIGLLSIDHKNSKAEYYISMGEPAYKGRGVAKEASLLLLAYGFETLGLNRIYLYTETENTAAQRLFERLGFQKEGCLRGDVFSRGQLVDRYVYGLMREDWSASHGA